MTEVPVQIEEAPLAWLRIDVDDRILLCNRAARELGFTVGDDVRSFLPALSGSLYQLASETSEAISLHFELALREKQLQLYPVESEPGMDIWLRDITDQLALAERARRLKNPEHRKLRQLNHLVVTSMGYSELLDVIIDDIESLSSEKVKAIRQYHRELGENLNQMQMVISEHTDVEEPARKSVVVVDHQEDLMELLTELLRTEGYKATGFTDARSAIKFCNLNAGSIDTIVIDETLRSEEGLPLEIALRAVLPEVGVVLLSSKPGDDGSIQKPVDFEVLLEAVRR